MASEVDICNMALSSIRAGKIATLDEGSTEASECKTHYANVRDFLLETFAWPFATKVEDLALVGTPPPDWLYQYAYPNQCRKAIEIVDSYGQSVDKSGKPLYPFDTAYDETQNARVILCDVLYAKLRYVKGITDTTLFPATFSAALAALLAHRVAYALTGNLKVKQEAMQQFQYAISTAKVVPLNERQTREQGTPPDASWVSARS